MSDSNELRAYITDADGLAMNKERALLVVEISREQVERCEIGGTMESLLVLTDTEENLKLYKQSLAFVVNGYDEDSRELPEIPEVRAFFSRLYEEWPFWIWFLNVETNALVVFLSLLCQVKIYRAPDGSVGTEFLDSAELFNLVQEMGNKMVYVLRQYNVPPKEFASLLFEVEQALSPS